MAIDNIRREYLHGQLTRKELLDCPIKQFGVWIEQVKGLGLSDPTALVLASVDNDGRPFQRVVLLKDFDERGFVFFTNYGSRKAQHIEKNPEVSLHFPWFEIDRQVAINGRAEKIPARETLKYFVSRPKDSQIAAWASKQSSPLSARSMLEQKFDELKRKFAEGEVPVPSFWGGYRVAPEQVEFWQGGGRRLHDRFVYVREADSWRIERLAP